MPPACLQAATAPLMDSATMACTAQDPLSATWATAQRAQQCAANDRSAAAAALQDAASTGQRRKRLHKYLDLNTGDVKGHRVRVG
jgi:hypothetical protein